MMQQDQPTLGTQEPAIMTSRREHVYLSKRIDLAVIPIKNPFPAHRQSITTHDCCLAKCTKALLRSISTDTVNECSVQNAYEWKTSYVPSTNRVTMRSELHESATSSRKCYKKRNVIQSWQMISKLVCLHAQKAAVA